MIKYSDVIESCEKIKINRKSSLENIIRNLVKVLPLTNTVIEADFFVKLLDFLRLIVCDVVNKLNLKNALVQGVKISDLTEFNKELIEYFVDLGVKVGVFNENDGLITLNKAYEGNEYYELKSVISASENEDVNFVKNTKNEKVRNFIFIYTLLEINIKNKKMNSLKKELKIKRKWEIAIKGAALSYQIMVAYYLLELRNVDLKDKTKFSLDESFYTELGRCAFENFTKESFIKIIKELTSSNSIDSALDIGCGYGRFIEELNKFNDFKRIIGVEQQSVVYKEIINKFKENQKVRIVNDNIFNLNLEEKVDVVLLNYILFYFSYNEKIKLLTKIKSLLKENGCIIICQYYSDFEKQQKAIAKLKGEDTLINKINMYFSTRLVAAETLLNETLDDFKEAESIRKFTNILDECGLEIKNIDLADKFYYSFFLVIQEKNSVRML